MPDSASLLESLQRISELTAEDMSERDVENLFLEQGFYDALDYEGTGTDLRSEFTLPDERRPDYITLDSNEAVTAVYEFKTSGRDLPPHENQLFGYMEFLRAEYGVLTNGEQLRLYRRDNDRPLIVLSMDAADREARRRRAEYVREAVDGRNVKSGETTTIPIPRKDSGVERLLTALRSNKETVDEIDNDALEERVNGIVYDMFGITSEEQGVIEEYLETFRVY